MKKTSRRMRQGEQFVLTAVAAAVAGSFCSGAAFAQAAAQEEATKLEEIEVTGSRLKRAEIEGALPVSVISRDDIERSGFTSVGELLRNTTFNSLGAFRAQSGSSAQGLVAVDLRGLGSERTLVLIDGRRAPKAPYAPSAQDLNAVPLAAVERIEILKDGASAIYGSDAIGGVINIITRKDYEGAEISYQVQGTDRKGGDIETGYVTVGINGPKGNAVMGASFYNRDIIFARDSILAERGGSFFSNNLVWLEDTNGSGVADAGDQYQYSPVPGGCPNSDPAFYITSTGLCGYDFNRVAADEAETGTQGLFARGTYHITDNWDFTANGSINRAKSFGRYAPSLNDVAVTVPINNPFLDEAAAGIDPATLLSEIYLYHRFASLGNRDTSTDANVYDVSGIFSGSLGIVNVDVGARYNEYKYFETGRNFVVLPLVQGVLNDGTYDFRDPAAGASAAESLRTTVGRESEWIYREAFFGVDLPVFDLPGGKAQLAIGGEYREEEFSDKYDSLSESGQVGGSAGNSSGTDRTVKALFGEMLFPILDNLEIGAALRYDRYSDYGSDVSPKLSLRYQPIDVLTLRASYGHGFRAPDLQIISQKPAFSAEPITNDEPTCLFGGGTWNAATNTCSISVQINATQISNPDLASEQSKQYSVGFAYDVASFFDFSIDYYNISMEDRIDTFSPEEILDALRVGDPVPPAFVVTRGNNNDPNARIVGLIFGFANSGDLDTSGLDMEANFRLTMGNWGSLKSQARAVYMLDYKIDNGRDLVGDPAFPEYRAMLQTEYRVWDLGFAWNMNVIGDQAQTPGTQTGHIGTYITHDLAATYYAPWKGELTVGALNVLGKEPDRRSQFDGRDYNFYLYDQYGTQPYVRYTQRF